MNPEQALYLLGLLADTVRAQQERIAALEAELRPPVPVEVKEE